MNNYVPYPDVTFLALLLNIKSVQSTSKVDSWPPFRRLMTYPVFACGDIESIKEVSDSDWTVVNGYTLSEFVFSHLVCPR